MSPNLIYLPVEVSRREIMARAFLACRLASAGHDVLVFASDLFDRFGWPGPGIYIGKNVFRTYVPHDLRYYRAMKAAGIDVWYHDEEAGLYPGDGPAQWEEHLERRTDVSVLGEGDKVLAWGDYQRDYYERKGITADVRVVGSVNFELYRPEYAHLFAAYDREQTNGERGYILVNTRFGFANGFYTGDRHVISDLYTGAMTVPERYENFSQEGVLLYHLVGLIGELAVTHPDERVVVRPHPAENPDFYRGVFELLPNVEVADKGDVGSWIRQSRCLLHNGCTTAIQASIAGKPVITFIPQDSRNDQATPPVLNELGAIVETREAAIAAIFDPNVEQSTGRWPMVISSLDTMHSIEALVGERGRKSSVDEQRLAAIGRRSAMDFRARHSLYRFVPSKNREVKMRERYFDRSLFDSFGELTELALKQELNPVRVGRVGPECWRVRPAG
jgi:surface carbohydrate biosynthesis protein